MEIIGKFRDFVYPDHGIDHVRDTARGVLHDGNGNVLVLKLYADDIFGIRDCYELPGGGVEEGETLEEAFLREMREETGSLVTDIREIGEVDDFYNLIHRENHNHYFLARKTGDTERKMEEYEKTMIQEIRWVRIDEAIRLFREEMHDGVGQLVSQRELPVLLKAKRMLLKSSPNH